jgi:hypothetical protein
MAKPKPQPKAQATQAMPEAPQMKPAMTLEQSKAHRASLHKPKPKPLNEAQKREAFRVFWASNKKKYDKTKTIEKAIWLHLKAMGMHSPEHFAQGLQNFGLKKVK